MKRYIDLTKALDGIGKGFCNLKCELSYPDDSDETDLDAAEIMVRECLYAAESASVVPVVRCNDCVHYRQTEDWNGHRYKACHLHANIIIKKTNPGDFCSFGEKVAGGAEDG